MECASHSVVPDSSPPHGLQPTRLLCPWDFIDEDTGGVCRVDGSLFFVLGSAMKQRKAEWLLAL